ncbi:MAG: HAD-IIB family hydrolase [Sediminispirochaetaceae bacterium]
MKHRTVMQPLERLAEAKRQLRFVLTDIDDTLTDSGKLGSPAYAAMWRLYNAGFILIPVTGRPAGWCDLIIRQWPVQAVVGENGAFVYYSEKKDTGLKIKTLYHPEVAGEDLRRRLEDLKKKVLAEVPGSRVARDQFARQFDLAIDFREDPPDLGFEAAERIRRVCEAEGAVAKISSIHVNAWFGNYDKISMTKLFLQRLYGLDEEQIKSQVIFCGDSPNDQPMFSFFPFSCGVSNLKDMLDYITVPPAYVTDARGGDGFVELADLLLDG